MKRQRSRDVRNSQWFDTTPNSRILRSQLRALFRYVARTTTTLAAAGQLVRFCVAISVTGPQTGTEENASD